MEKTNNKIPNINNIIAFIEKAMKKNLDITCNCDRRGQFTLTVYKDDDNSLSIDRFIDYNTNKYNIDITKSRLNSVNIEETSELDVANLNIVVLKAKEYSNNKIIEYFNNFFNNNAPIRNINDIDEEGDE